MQLLLRVWLELQDLPYMGHECEFILHRPCLQNTMRYKSTTSELTTVDVFY